jgi:hypothetical protein
MLALSVEDSATQKHLMTTMTHFLFLMMLVPDDERGCPKFSFFWGVSPPPTSFRWPQQGNGTTPANPAPHTIAIWPQITN